jgi:hypothetical protein
MPRTNTDEESTLNLDRLLDEAVARAAAKYSVVAPLPAVLTDVRGVARLCGGDPPPHAITVRRWVKEGRLPAPLKIGGKLHRWQVAEVIEALKKMPRASIDEVT